MEVDNKKNKQFVHRLFHKKLFRNSYFFAIHTYISYIILPELIKIIFDRATVVCGSVRAEKM